MLSKKGKLSDQVFNGIQVKEFLYTKDRNGFYNCVCFCGKPFIAVASHIKQGRKTSCGCSQAFRDTKNLKEYQIHSYMKSRCLNPKYTDYERYGGRGITICDRWIGETNWEGFENFLEDMGPRPSDKHTLDRINVNGNYEPSNCRWVTRDIQAQNTRQNVVNAQIVRSIRWDYEVNKFTRYRLQIKYNLGKSTIEAITSYRNWKNISIQEEKEEFLKYGTFNGKSINAST